MKKLLPLTLLASSAANASGLLMQEAVVANAGTTGAGDGVYTESAAASWANPATMSHMGEQLTTINAMVFALEMDYSDNVNPGAGDGLAQTTMPSASIFHVRQMSDKVHLGLNFAAVGGSVVEWGNDWGGAAGLDTALMSVLQFNPAISYQYSENLSFGAGVQIAAGLLELSTAMLETGLESDFAYGYNLGAMYKQDRWSVGASYRSKVEFEFNDVIAKTTVPIDTDMGTFPVGTELTIGTNLITPAIFDVSGSYSITPKLDLLASIQFHQWSDFTGTPIYNELNVPLEIDRDWDDVWKYAIAADYQLNSNWALKAGFSYETSPQDDPTKQWVDLPVGEQYRYSVGASTYWGETVVDIFYQYADLGTTNIERMGVGISGQFDNHIHFIGANFSF